MSEFALIETIRERTALERNDVTVGIGDDGAILVPSAGHDLVVCSDTLIAGMHFPHGTRAWDIGWKAVAVNLSDLAAMGAEPAWATLSLTVPDDDMRWVAEFADGFAAIAHPHRLALVGGDTTRGTLTIGLTVIGQVPRGNALTRGGARVGDDVFVTGTLGDAAAGLTIVRDHALLDRNEQDLVTRLNRPTPRVETGIALRGIASACIDVSDGLVADFNHVCRRSGVGAEIEAALLPASTALSAWAGVSLRRKLQLGGGDDYELAFSAAPKDVERVRERLAAIGVGVTRIGRVVDGECVRVLDDDGSEIDVDRGGWEHFG
jgi:thiamine-monophosphate kinase